jgi:hypothetical protein
LTACDLGRVALNSWALALDPLMTAGSQRKTGTTEDTEGTEKAWKSAAEF